MIDWSLYPNFSRHEFDSPDLENSGDSMQEVTLDKIQRARTSYGKAIHVTRGYSTINHNNDIGGVKDSAHIKGHAVDISMSDSRERFILLMHLLKAGFTRIGVYNKHIHVDDDPNKDRNVLWVGTSK